MSNREIAAALVVEESTVRTRVKRILMKLDLRDRAQAWVPQLTCDLVHDHGC
jgi:DNA-binding NarL/FixJ family response regulator